MTPGDDLGRFRYLELCNIHVVLAVGLELNFRKSPNPPLVEVWEVVEAEEGEAEAEDVQIAVETVEVVEAH